MKKFYSQLSLILALILVINLCNIGYVIEVKAEENVKSKSLKTVYDADHALCPVRFSMLGYKKQEWMENVPLYASMEYIRSKE